jgi:uncharacterized membrane protein
MSFLSSRGWLVGRGVGCWGGNSGRLEGVWRVKWQEFEEADVEVLFRDAGISKGFRRCWLGIPRVSAMQYVLEQSRMAMNSVVVGRIPGSHGIFGSGSGAADRSARLVLTSSSSYSLLGE